MRRILAVAVPFLSVALAGCFDGPAAGEVTLSLVTPNADDGAVSFVVMVAAPNEVTGASAVCTGCDVFYTRVSGTELRGIVTGDLVAGPVVRLAVSDAGPNQAYRVDVLEVSNRQFSTPSPNGYNLTIQR